MFLIPSPLFFRVQWCSCHAYYRCLITSFVCAAGSSEALGQSVRNAWTLLRWEAETVSFCIWDLRWPHSGQINGHRTGTSLLPVMAFQYRPPPQGPTCWLYLQKAKSMPHERRQALVFLVHCLVGKKKVKESSVAENVIYNSLAQPSPHSLHHHMNHIQVAWDSNLAWTMCERGGRGLTSSEFQNTQHYKIVSHLLCACLDSVENTRPASTEYRGWKPCCRKPKCSFLWFLFLNRFFSFIAYPHLIQRLFHWNLNNDSHLMSDA